MKGRRLILMTAMALAGSSGCAALGLRPGTPPKPALARKPLEAQDFVATYNENAERIKDLQARPSIGVSGQGLRGRVDGHLALEQPRNFKLVLNHVNSNVADIGSNDQEFWFWVQSKQDKSIYWCDHADRNKSALAQSFQPDWIAETMGVRPISSAEAASLTTRDGPEPGTTTIVFAGSRNSPLGTREMVVWNHNKRIKDYRLYSSDHKTVIAQAEIKGYKTYTLDSTDSESLADVCHLPENVRLEWKPEQLTLDVTLKDVRLNLLDPSKSASRFVEPKIPGYARVNLAELAGGRSPESGTTVRRTLPAPPHDGNVKLGRPTPIDDTTSMTTPRRARFDEVVGAPMPTAPGDELTQGNSPAGFWAGR